jgi:AcrR family transcriptional regulator
VDTQVTNEAGLRERKKAQLRRALQAAALRLAGENGYDHLTVEAIAAACDVSTRTFFNYFSSKDEALIGPILEHRRLIGIRFDARPTSEGAIESLRGACAEVADSLNTDTGQWQLRRRIFQETPSLLPRVHAAFAEMERGLTDAVAARLGVDSTVDPYPALVVAQAITALRVGALHWHTTTQPQESLPDLVRRLLDVTFNALPSPAPISPAPLAAPAGELMEITQS